MLNFESCWVRRRFINSVKCILWQILNYLGLLTNSANVPVIYVFMVHRTAKWDPITSSHSGCRSIPNVTCVYVPKMPRVCGAEYLLSAHQPDLNIISGNAVFPPRGEKPEFCLPERCPPQRFPITMNNSNRSKQNIYNSGKQSAVAFDICFGSIGMKNGNVRM